MKDDNALKAFKDAHAVGKTILFKNEKGLWVRIKDNEPKWDALAEDYLIADEPVDDVEYVNLDPNDASQTFETFWEASNAFSDSYATVILKFTYGEDKKVEALVWA